METEIEATWRCAREVAKLVYGETTTEIQPLTTTALKM
tara:strand:- start:234 stop:347 length:114 start_codon:yes stop_codon:yes gene_type:complete